MTTIHRFVIHIGDLGVSGTMQANVVVVPTPWVYAVRLWAVVPCIADLGGAWAIPFLPWGGHAWLGLGLGGRRCWAPITIFLEVGQAKAILTLFSFAWPVNAIFHSMGLIRAHTIPRDAAVVWRKCWYTPTIYHRLLWSGLDNQADPESFLDALQQYRQCIFQSIEPTQV